MANHKFSWKVNNIKNFKRLRDLLVYNGIMDGFPKVELISRHINKIENKLKQFDSSFILEMDKNKNLLFFQLKKVSFDKTQMQLFALVELDTTGHLEAVFYEDDHYQMETFNVYLAGIHKYLLSLQSLFKQYREFERQKAAQVMHFTFLLNKRFEQLAKLLYQNQNAVMHTSVREAISDLDSFIKEILKHCNTELPISHGYILDNPVFTDLIESLLRYRFLFKQKNVLISKLVELIIDEDHPMFSFIQNIYYQESLPEIEGRARPEEILVHAESQDLESKDFTLDYDSQVNS